jgi:hypothetical protein
LLFRTLLGRKLSAEAFGKMIVVVTKTYPAPGLQVTESHLATQASSGVPKTTCLDRAG